MLELIFGVVLGGFGAWFGSSRPGRERLQQWFSAAPEPMRQQANAMVTTTVSGINRVGGAVDATPVTRQLKDRLVQATSAARPRAGDVGSPIDAQPTEQPLTAFVDNPEPEEIRAEEDAAAQAAADARRERETGA